MFRQACALGACLPERQLVHATIKNRNTGMVFTDTLPNLGFVQCLGRFPLWDNEVRPGYFSAQLFHHSVFILYRQ